jgi:rubredoxin
MSSYLKYECPDCGYIYDEAQGCDREGYSPGTKWEDLPDDFPCPDCFVREKPDFLLID